MEIIQFYLPNILVGAILSIVLSLYGAHVVSRNKTVEVLLLGQSIQVGILIGVILTSVFFSLHQDHGVHPEMLVSLFFTAIIYAIYQKLTRLKKYAKTPTLVLILTLLMALSYLIVAASPLVESHMVKSYLGDIVTASKFELYAICAFSFCSLFFYWKKKNEIELQSFDMAMFGHLISSSGVSTYWLFNFLVLVLMVSSIHILGIVFTLCMMIFPITIAQFSNFTVSQFIKYIILTSPLSVIVGFILNIQYEHFPTSGLITIANLILGTIAVYVFKFLYRQLS